jgi:hypothetical protein
LQWLNAIVSLPITNRPIPVHCLDEFERKNLLPNILTLGKISKHLAW